MGKPLARSQPRWERLGHVGDGPGVSLDQGQDLGRGESLRGGVVGHGAATGQRLGGSCVGLDGEAVAAPVGAVQDQPGAGGIAGDEPGLVEERRLHHPGLVTDRGFDQGTHAATADRARGDGAHLHDNRGALLRRELDHGARLALVPRQMPEQIANRVETERLRGAGRLLAGNVEARVQPRRPGVADRRRLERFSLGRSRAREQGGRHGNQ